MLHKRCPWCGETAKPGKKGHWMTYVYSCEQCNQHYRDFVFNRINTWLLFLFCFWILVVKREISILPDGIMLGVIILLGVKSPLYRYEGYYLFPLIADRGREIKVSLRWGKHKEGGLLFSRIRIWNNYILPMYITDDIGNVISKANYVRINKIRNRFFGQTTAYVKFVHEEQSILLDKPDTRFILSDNNKEIAYGIAASQSRAIIPKYVWVKAAIDFLKR